MSRANMKRLLCLWLPNWPIQRLLAPALSDGSPEPANLGNEAITARCQTEAAAEHKFELTGDSQRPVVLWGNDLRRGRVVVARCLRSATLGVRTGMTLSQADALLHGGGPASGRPVPATNSTTEQSVSRDTTEAWFVPHDSQADLDALLDLAERCAECLSPLIALEPLDDYLWAGQPLHQPQSLLMEVTGIGDLFGGEEGLLAAAAELCHSLGYQPRLAIADTVGAAWGIAHYAHPNPQPEVLAAELAPQAVVRRIPLVNDVAGWIVQAGAEATALDRLPVAALRVRSEVTNMLRRLGVQHIGALRKLPRAGLASRLGREPLSRLDQALGVVDEPLPIHHQATSHQATQDLEYPTNDREILGHCLNQLVHQVAEALAGAQRGALRITCRLWDVDQQTLEMRLGLFTPTAAADHLSRLLQGSLERRRCPALVQRITVMVTMTGPLEVRQPTFRELGPLYDWNHQQVGAFADLARLVDGLSERLGRQRVIGFETTHDPLPEQAVRWRPLTGQPSGAMVPGRPLPADRKGGLRKRRHGRRRTAASQPDSSSQPSAPLAGSGLENHTATPLDPLRRPLRLLPSPQPIHPLEALTCTTRLATPPKQFRYAGRVYHTIRYWGPERLETGWWRGPQRRRDYFRIETSDGQWFWIFADLRESEAWYLHGFFS